MGINTVTSAAKDAADFENTFGSNFGCDIQRDDGIVMVRFIVNLGIRIVQRIIKLGTPLHKDAFIQAESRERKFAASVCFILSLLSSAVSKNSETRFPPP